MSAPRSTATIGHRRAITHPAVANGALARCATVALAVIVVDIGTKIAATTVLGDRIIPAGGATFLGVVYNDAFARGGGTIGSLAVPATLLLAAILLFVIGRVCAPLAAVDRGASWGLGLVAGATAANALDFVRTGRGVVDFLGVRTAGGSVVFNLADVAAYLGVVILARTAWLVARAALEEQRLRDSEPRYSRIHAAAEVAWAERHHRPRSPELVRSVPIFVETPPAGVPAEKTFPLPPHAPGTGRQSVPELGDADLTVPTTSDVGRAMPELSARPKLTLIVNRPPAR